MGVHAFGRGPLGGPEFSGERDFPLSTSSCGLPATAQAYSLNATVVPAATLGYLTLWPQGETQPVVSTLNSPDGSINVKRGHRAHDDRFHQRLRQLWHPTDPVILDTNGYFAP